MTFKHKMMLEHPNVIGYATSLYLVNLNLDDHETKINNQQISYYNVKPFLVVWIILEILVAT